MTTSTRSIPPIAPDALAQTIDRPVASPVARQQAQSAESAAPCSSQSTGTFCAGIRNNGERCRARPSQGYDFCSFHRKDLKQTVQAGRVAGGRRGRCQIAPFDEPMAARLAFNLDSRGGIQGLIDMILRQAFIGAISPATVGAIARLLNVALRNLDRTDRHAEDHTLDLYLANVSHMEEFLKAMAMAAIPPPAATVPGGSLMEMLAHLLE